jgi:UDP-glucose 4-epimerase
MLKFQSYLITGGCGFIGSHLAETLLKMGATRVVLLDSLEYGQEFNVKGISEDVEIFRHRLGTDPAVDLSPVLGGIDCLFHLAAEKHNQSIENPIKVIDANIKGTFELFAAALMNNVKKVVFASSLYAYGRMSGTPFLEDEVPQPKTVYGMSKLSGENLARFFSVRHGMQIECLRFMFVYGPKQFAQTGYKSVIIKTFERLLNNEPPLIFGNGEQVLDYIYVSDAVSALVKASHSEIAFDITNVGTGVGISINKLVSLIQGVAGKSLEPIYCPPDLTHHSYRVGEMSKFKKKFGYSPMVPVEEGLQHTFSWMKATKS